MDEIEKIKNFDLAGLNKAEIQYAIMYKAYDMMADKIEATAATPKEAADMLREYLHSNELRIQQNRARLEAIASGCFNADDDGDDDYDDDDDVLEPVDEEMLNNHLEIMAETAEIIYGKEVAEFLRSHTPHRMAQARESRNPSAGDE